MVNVPYQFVTSMGRAVSKEHVYIINTQNCERVKGRNRTIYAQTELLHSEVTIINNYNDKLQRFREFHKLFSAQKPAYISDINRWTKVLAMFMLMFMYLGMY